MPLIQLAALCKEDAESVQSSANEQHPNITATQWVMAERL
jgi:hypothetical protein